MTCFATFCWAVFVLVAISGVAWWLEDNGIWPTGHR